MVDISILIWFINQLLIGGHHLVGWFMKDDYIMGIGES